MASTAKKPARKSTKKKVARKKAATKKKTATKKKKTANWILSITGGQGGYYIVGAEQPHGWRNGLPREPHEGMVELVAGGQRATYPLALCLPQDVVLEVAHEFVESQGARLSAACRWDNAPTPS